ncbi:MAG: hypothetical protein HN712_02350 [Gemmatimonadetes bacterium]|nr:hypothetical protein [Gemmatimonadota bacterium]MBT6147266.1 hypothetical protein [Gemmatimonadota bacterium]MBT7859117.1 hypothetical protein [Gemmatimonadota bacterium]
MRAGSPWSRFAGSVHRLKHAGYLGACLVALAIGWMPAVVQASTAIAKVSIVEGAEVVIDAGHEDGLTVTAKVTLLREGEPIIHPLTGAVLGMPQEPVGTVHIYEVEAHSARGGLVKMYSDPLVGDLAEFEPKVAATTAPAPDVAQVKERVEQLSQHVEEYQRRSERRLGTYPDFARRVLDEIAAMKSYLVSLDERMVELEEQQNEHHFRLSSVLSGEYAQEDLKEFTIRYSPDTQVRLRAAGKTLMIDVVADSIHLTPVDGQPVAMATDVAVEGESSGFMDLFDFGGDDEDGAQEIMAPEMPMEDEEGELWYTSVYHLAAGVGLIFALLIMVVLVIKRRYSDVMDGLDDFDEDEYEGYLDDEEEEEEDED